MSEIKHTPGPWRWEINRHAKQVELCGGDGSRRGIGGIYDCPVMTFKRYGMSSAAPVFWEWDTDRGVAKSEPLRADKLAVEVAGREHHAIWFADIDHPNARLIAAAPELLEVAKACREVCLFGDDDGIGVSEDVVIPSALFDRICAAINKAEGRS